MRLPVVRAVEEDDLCPQTLARRDGRGHPLEGQTGDDARVQ